MVPFSRVPYRFIGQKDFKFNFLLRGNVMTKCSGVARFLPGGSPETQMMIEGKKIGRKIRKTTGK